MKVLIVNPSCWIYGGAERVIVKLANWLDEHHHTVTLVTTQMNKRMKDDFKNLRIVYAKDFSDLRDFVQNAAQDFDVINIHNEPGYLSVYPRKRNVVWLCNEPPHLDDPVPEEYELNAVKNFKAVVADEFNAKRFEGLYKIKPRIINYGIDYDFFSETTKDMLLDNLRSGLGIEKDDYVITQVGFVADTKNQLRTLRIFKQVKEKMPNAKLILAGQHTAYVEEVKKYVEENGLMGDVILTGFVSREQVRDIYQISDIALFPIKSQGGWLSVFEAMSAGLPVLVSKEATCSSILDEHALGYVCNTDEDFVKSILARPEAEEYSAEWVKENLTWDKFCEEMYDEFKRACE